MECNDGQAQEQRHSGSPETQAQSESALGTWKVPASQATNWWRAFHSFLFLLCLGK